MKLKDGVVLLGLQLQMRVVLMTAESIWKAHGQELVITSTAEGVHSSGSLHPYGYAVDLRTRDFNDVEARTVSASLRNALPAGYDVVLYPHRYDDFGERTAVGHIHAEWDDAKKLQLQHMRSAIDTE